MLKYLTSSLKRDTQSTKFIPEIDGMRFFAIITVVIFHLNTSYAKSMNLGLSEAFSILHDHDMLGIGWWIKRFDIGVKVFFAISGFILAVPFVKYSLGTGKRINLKNYFIRRLTRLEPPYVISLVIFYIVHLVLLDGNFEALTKSLGLGIFYLHSIVVGTPNPINPVTWSLETEAQFYIIIPVFMSFLFLFKSRNKLCFLFFLLFSASVFLKYYFMNIENPYLINTILVFFINFLVGIFVAHLYLMFKPFFDRKSIFWDLIHLLSIFVMFYFYKPQAEILNIILLNFGIFLFFISVFKSVIFNWFYTQPLIYIIGGMCYSIYLLHYAFFHLSVSWTSKLMVFNSYLGNLMIQLLINTILVLIVSTVFFILIEKPFMSKKWIKKL